MSSGSTSVLTLRPTRLSMPARQQVPTTALVAVVTGALRRPAAAVAAAAGAVLSVIAITLLLRSSPVWMFRDADARMWHPGDGFDLSAGRALVEGLEVAAAALGLVGKLRLATLTVAMLGLVLCLLHI
jgi:hypothetical protein